MGDVLREGLKGLGDIIGEAFNKAGVSAGAVGAVLAALVVLALTTRAAWPWLASGWDARRRHIPRALQGRLTALLSNEAVLRFYAPDDRFIRDLAEDEKKPLTRAWLSPWRRAVKASVKNHGRVLKSQAFDARRQVRTAASQVTVRTLTEKEATQWKAHEDAPLAAYAVVLSHNGRPASEVAKLREPIKSQLKAAGGIFPIDDGDPTKTTLIICEQKMDDALVSMKCGVEWFDENPAKTPDKLPMAYTATGDTWGLPTHHTLIAGATGSGKSGPLLATIRQLAPFVEKGIVKLWAIDPKATDLDLFSRSNLFAGGIATTTPDAIDLINRFHHDMKDRNENKVINLEAGETGQQVKVSRKTPMNVLLIDEVLSLKGDFESEGQAGKAAWRNLIQILAQGRSAAFYVIAATQDPTKEQLGPMRQNFVNAILFKQDSAFINDLMLGAGAAERGYDSTAIPASNKDNGYMYSGIGYVKGESGAPVRVRFAYLSQEDTAAFVLAHPAGKATGTTTASTSPTGEQGGQDGPQDARARRAEERHIALTGQAEELASFFGDDGEADSARQTSPAPAQAEPRRAETPAQQTPPAPRRTQAAPRQAQAAAHRPQEAPRRAQTGHGLPTTAPAAHRRPRRPQNGTR